MRIPQTPGSADDAPAGSARSDDAPAAGTADVSAARTSAHVLPADVSAVRTSAYVLPADVSATDTSAIWSGTGTDVAAGTAPGTLSDVCETGTSADSSPGAGTDASPRNALR